ncbi:MAG TPA: ATP-binding cassette domain-containing protein, partial [Bacteroidetes bacterium]|nr:ATP-binding cassette domain-containing protein [Bacteroidota bacterium]
MAILKIENVVKRFHKKTAVNGISFEIGKGSIFGLLGPNGAGKTTLIRIITSIFNADEGTIYFNGEKLNEFHPRE